MKPGMALNNFLPGGGTDALAFANIAQGFLQNRFQ
jgi:hypothetical protein